MAYQIFTGNSQVSRIGAYLEEELAPRRRVEGSRPPGPRSAVRDIGACPSCRLPGRRGGGHGHLHMGLRQAPSRGERPISSRENVDAPTDRDFVPSGTWSLSLRHGRDLTLMSSGR